ncbi:MAG: cytochrome D1 domain-containing protein, partial [Azovibrio sp.]
MFSQSSRLASPLLRGLLIPALAWLLSACSSAPTVPELRGTGDLGVVIERADGRLKIIETTGRSVLATVKGLGDLSHASVVFSRDARYAYIFGRDGGLT